MIRAKQSNDAKRTPWYTKAGAACSIIPIARFIDPHVFALKGGGYGCVFSLTGIEEEGQTDEELDSRIRLIENALRGLPMDACLYQYMRVLQGFEIPRQESYANPVTENFVNDRLEFLRQNAGFRRVLLNWCLSIEPDNQNPFQRKPQQFASDNSRVISSLRKTAAILENTLADAIGLRLIARDEAFQLFSQLYNLAPWSENAVPVSDSGIDRQIVRSPLSLEDGFLKIGNRCVRMFSLVNAPEVSRPCQFSNLMTLDCDAILCTTWRPKTAAQARDEINQQEKFIQFFKTSVLNRVMAGRDQASVETGANAIAANASVDELGEVVHSLDKTAQGQFALRLLLAADTKRELEEASPAVHRHFVDARAQVMEENIGNLSAFYTMFPGNRRFNVYPLWLAENHNARFASVYAPHLGHPHSDDLDREYLNVFETRSGTPFFHDAYVNGVRVQLIIGPTGSGKSVHANQMIAMEQKYGGFTYIFDIGNSYESQVLLYGGKVERIGTDGPRVNIFALEPTEANIQFLYTFVKLLLTNGGAETTPEDDEVIHKAVAGMYQLDAGNRRLSNLFLPRHLDRYLAKWVGKGVYAAIFDNIEDTLKLSRLQCFDFQGINNSQNAELIEPLMVWLLRRINDVLLDRANLGIPKHIVIEELFSSMKNKQLLEAALASIKTVRKNLGGVTMIGQSANDLGENADSIVNSCTSFLFLPDATFNRKFYGELFKMTEQQLNLFDSLRPREALYMRRDGLTKVVRLNLDPTSYATFSTKPKDRARRSDLIEKFGLKEGIRRSALGDHP